MTVSATAERSRLRGAPGILQRLLALALPREPASDAGQSRRARQLALILVGTAAAVAFWTAASIAVPALRHRVVLAAPLVVVLAASAFLNARARTRPASLVLVAGFWLTVHLAWWTLGAAREVTLAWALLIVLMAALLLGGPAAFALAGLSVVTGLVTLWAQSRGLLPRAIDDLSAIAAAYISILVLAIALLHVATHSIEESLLRSRAELDERRRAEAVLQRRVRELGLLGSVATIAAEEPDEETLIARATAVVRDTLFSDNCGIMLCDDGEPVLRYTRSFHAASSRAKSAPCPLGVGIVGRVAQSGLPRRVRDTTQEPDYVARDPGMLSEICVPLKVGERILGVFDVESSRRDAFTEDDERVLSTLGSLLASAIARLRAGVSVRASEERFRALVHSAWDVVSIHDAELRVTYVSPSVTRVLGYVPDQLIGRDSRELVHPDDRQRAGAAVAQILQQPSVDVSYELRARKADGSWAWLEAVACNLLELPAVRGIVLTTRDVSERRRAQQSLRESEERWRRISEASFEGIAFSEQGILLDVNEQFAEMLGYAIPELIGKPVVELVAPEHRALVEARMRAGSTLGYAHLAQRSDGALLPVETRARQLKLGERTLRVTVVRDMSERARLESELEKRRQLAAVGELVTGVAHEVRTPLFGISANLDLYENQLDSPGDKREFFGALRAQVQRLNGLMSDLLEYGRPPSLRFVRGGVAAIAARAVRACARQAADAGVAIHEEYAAGLDGLDRDPERLEQVFQNLISNALHYSPRGATVRVSIFQSSEPAGVICAVQDEGPGLAAGDAALVFQPFFSRRRGGTGLGLAIVQRIVEQHGGSVRADNREAGGAIFTVFLPAPDAQAA